MSEQALTQAAPIPPGDELRKLIARASKGDEKAMAQLRPVFDAAPRLWQNSGDLATAAERSLIDAASGTDLVMQEKLLRQAAAMRAELGSGAAPPLERLLIERIVACWMALHYAETVYAQNMATTDRRWSEFHQRRISHAHTRYLASIRTLAQVRRLLVPVVQLNVAERQVNVVQAGAVPADLAPRDELNETTRKKTTIG